VADALLSFKYRLKLKRFVLYIFSTASVLCANAQVQVESKIDSIQILIGQQAHVTLNVSMKRGQSLEMPVFKPSEQIIPGVEVLDQTEADTSELDNDMVRVQRVYTVTSFDEKLYYLPPFKVKVGGKEYETKNLALKVLTVPVDTLHPEQFFPPKDVQDNPFQWSEWSPVFWLGVLIILFICIAFYLRMRLYDNKPILARVRIIKKVLPHQRAMSEIEKIKEERMQTSENQKEYYTRLTDTLRRYIEERFGFNAMEMTSSEIISRLQDAEDKTMIDELRELFMTADLVKFAKYNTLINENDANLVSAIEFINTTKQENQPTTERVEPQLTAADKRSMKERVALKCGVALCLLAALVLFVYVVYSIWMLL